MAYYQITLRRGTHERHYWRETASEADELLELIEFNEVIWQIKHNKLTFDQALDYCAHHGATCTVTLVSQRYGDGRVAA